MYYSQNDEQKILFHISYRWHKLWPEKIEANTTIVQQHRLSIKIALMMFQVFDLKKRENQIFSFCSDEQKILFHISYRCHKLWPEKIEGNITIIQQHRLSIKIALVISTKKLKYIFSFCTCLNLYKSICLKNYLSCFILMKTSLRSECYFISLNKLNFSVYNL